jgi:hypothetical protein
MVKISMSYHLSEEIKKSIQESLVLRQKILLSLLPPKVELRMRWEADLQRIFWGLSIAETPISKADMTKLLASPQKKRLNQFEKEIINYKKTLNFIKEEWLASSKIVTPNSLLDLYNLACRPVFGSSTASFKAKRKDIKQFLSYLQTGKEHPLIQAGISQIEIIKLSPFDNGSARVARLFTYLMLYKYGFDCRGLLVLEEYYRKDIVGLREAVRKVDEEKNLTAWLEYFTKGIFFQLQKAFEEIESPKFKTDLSASFWKLNSRQKLILSHLENPELKITNKDVQKMFTVAQITASRSLSKLASLGLILSHGKGRSVFYTRA